MSVTVVVGNPKPRSRTYDAAHAVAEALAGRPADATFDLADLGPRPLDWSDDQVSAAVVTVQASDLVVVATPTYKGTYTGLLKLFLDRFGGGSLAGVVAVPLMLGSDRRHSLAPEVFLKPVLAELGTSTPTTGPFLIDSQWAESDVLPTWLERARPRVAVLTKSSA